MQCANCGANTNDGDRFCNNCGAALQKRDGLLRRQPTRSRVGLNEDLDEQRAPGRPRVSKAKNPYRDQIAQLRLQIKELKLQLRELNNHITGTRSNYFEIDSFLRRGPLRRVGRMVEGAQLFGPYQQRKQLQDQIAQLEYQLLSLEKSQEQWRSQQ
ncbi:hypothetical protein ccbrp13_08930 [Ktedonobacteria bacterium brp13]|nr:hypothetical protein ccbrp13_08930 [Ktedonobacteria bacterium brp13]